MEDKALNRVAARLFYVLTISVTLGLAGCGGGGGSGSTSGGVSAPAPDTTKPTATIDQSGPAITKDTAIVVTFSEPMYEASLKLGGALAAASDGGTWSSNSDTLTLKPSSTWPRGPGLDLTVDAQDQAGNALDTLRKTYLVSLEFSNFDPATIVVGQADFTGTSSNQGGSPDANTLQLPYGNQAVSSAGKLFIGDLSNNRVLAYDALPTVNDANADFVLGQPDFTTTSASNGQSGLHGPQQVATAGGKMVVADFGNNRALLYGSIPSSGSALPDVVVGQADFTSNVTTCDAVHASYMETANLSADGKLVATDSGHNRVLIWNSLPTSNGQPADLVLGQADFTHCAANDDNQDGAADAAPTARSLNYPAGIWTDGDRLVVSDYKNNRVLIWTSFPTSNFQPADIVLGQADFTHAAANDDNQDGSSDGAPTARTLNKAYDGVDSNGVQLAIADLGNNRVLIWNSFPTSNFQSADVVLGQGDFAHFTKNDDNQDGSTDAGATARVMYSPEGVQFYQDKLVVGDLNNNRVLIFQSQ